MPFLGLGLTLTIISDPDLIIHAGGSQCVHGYMIIAASNSVSVGVRTLKEKRLEL